MTFALSDKKILVTGAHGFLGTSSWASSSSRGRAASA